MHKQEHKDLCIITALFTKLIDLFAKDTMYQELLLSRAEMVKKERGIVHCHLPKGRLDLETITNKDLLMQGGSVDLEVKVLKVEMEADVEQAKEEASQWEIAQDYGRHYTVGSEFPLVLTVPWKEEFFTRSYVVELL